MKNFEESVVYWQGLGKKKPNESFFSKTRQSGADPVIMEARLLFPERHASPSICLTAGSQFFLGFRSMFKNIIMQVVE